MGGGGSKSKSTTSVNSSNLNVKKVINTPESVEDLIILAKKKGSSINLSYQNDEDGIGNLVKYQLQPLHIVPWEVFTILTLTDINFKKNNIKEIPEEIGRLMFLENLNVSENMLTEIPVTIGHCTNLIVLDISENEIITLPQSLGNCGDLTELIAYKNKLQLIPDEIGDCMGLKNVNFFNNSLIKLPQSFGNLKNLEECNIAGNKLKTIPKFNKCVRMWRLAAMWNNIVMVPSLADLSNIRQLQLYDNLVSHVELAPRLPWLEEIDLGKTDLQKIPPTLEFAPKLQTINLRGCKINHVPDWIGNLPELATVNLGNNLIESFPGAVAKSKSIKVIMLDGCDRLKSLPIELKEMNHLVRLLVNGCSLDADDRDTMKVIEALSIVCKRNNGFIKADNNMLRR